MRRSTLLRPAWPLSIAAATLIAGGAKPAFAAPPAIYQLGTLPGGLYSYGFSINASGQVAGGSAYNTASFIPPRHAFRYTGLPGSGGAMADLGTLGGSGSDGNGINVSGQVAGSGYLSGDGTYHAFRYTGTPGSGGAMVDLGTLAGSTAFTSSGNDINDSGQVVGTSYITGGIVEHAFRTAPNAVINPLTDDLGTLGGSTSAAYGITAIGQVVGTSSTGSVDHAFRTAPNAAINPLTDDLGTLGGASSSGADINASGQVVGYSDTSVGGESHAFRYTGTPGSGGVMADLGTLGGPYSSASAINNAGQVVGISDTNGDGFDGQHVFLYVGTPGSGGAMIDLDAWLDANLPSAGAQWTLKYANDINDAGLITGIGFYKATPSSPELYRAYILDASSLVPEPGSLSLLAIGGVALLRRRRLAVH